MIWPILEARPEIIEKISTAFWTMEFQGKLLLNWCWHCKESIFEIRLPFSKHDLLPISHCSLSFSISFNFGFTTDAQSCKKSTDGNKTVSDTITHCCVHFCSVVQVEDSMYLWLRCVKLSYSVATQLLHLIWMSWKYK